MSTPVHVRGSLVLSGNEAGNHVVRLFIDDAHVDFLLAPRQLLDLAGQAIERLEQRRPVDQPESAG
jgi:hypothetical protein